MSLSKEMVHEALTELALTRSEYAVHHTNMVTCVLYIGLVYGNCRRLIQLEIVVDVVMVLESLLINRVHLAALVELLLYMKYIPLAHGPYQIQFLSYMNDLFHYVSMEVVGLISFSYIICVVAVTEGLLLSMTLSFVIGKRCYNVEIQRMAITPISHAQLHIFLLVMFYSFLASWYMIVISIAVKSKSMLKEFLRMIFQKCLTFLKVDPGE